MAYEDRLKELGLAQTCSGKALTAVYSYLLGGYRTDKRLFSEGHSRKTRRIRHKW